MKTNDALQPYTIAVRAYATKPNKDGKAQKTHVPIIGFSEWTLIFDTETTTDAMQKLRFGCYQVRKAGKLIEKGIFYDPTVLTKVELSSLCNFATMNGIRPLPVQDFINEVFFEYVYKLSALCIGFNLPFDLSRLAIAHCTAKDWRGGFSFALCENECLPRVRVKHLNSRASLIQFTVPAQQRASGSFRKRRYEVPPHRGYFLDVKTLASALLSGSWSLQKLADHLKTNSRKMKTVEHGARLTREYLRYAMQDVQATWECFERLQEQYQGYGLTQKPINLIYSEASLGKAYLQEMGIRPWREMQPDFPPTLLGKIMSTYYGGRSEVHIRRQITRVLYCDFLSMYPTVCTLMRLWQFVISEKTAWRDATAYTQTFLEAVQIEDLQNQETWAQLTTIVQIQPEDDILPVRAKYSGKQYSIGLNHLTSKTPMWYTLADCIASKILTGRAPKILQAIRFEPQGQQNHLQPIKIAGNSAYRINPLKDDFYSRLIELRSEVKTKSKNCSAAEKARLDVEQQALKICANATSYGIFVELNDNNSTKRQKVTCHADKPFQTIVARHEEPGKYFHPLLASLITGAARLMLAIAERLAQDSEITWAFCDTDSMALAKPNESTISDNDFINRAKRVQEWFLPLNPYRRKESLFKIEDVNFGLIEGQQSKRLAPLYCYAISAKRYALFNLSDRKEPIIRKASAHGLGHLLAPYDENNAPQCIPKPSDNLAKIGVDRWQYDLWFLIVKAALDGQSAQINLDALPGFAKVAVSRYAATSPDLLHWFKKFNTRFEYCKQVKPFNFLLSFFPKSENKNIAPIAAYDKEHSRALKRVFDRNTGESISPEKLKTYRETLAQYHLHPEAKFDSGDYLDCGLTRRKRIIVCGIEHIGKEANHLEEQFYLGCDLDAQLIYGMPKKDREQLTAVTIRKAKRFSQRELAHASGYSLREISRLLCGQVPATPAAIARLQAALNALEQEQQETAEILANAKHAVQKIGLRKFAKQAGIDPANLSNVISGKRPPSPEMLAKLLKVLMNRDT